MFTFASIYKSHLNHKHMKKVLLPLLGLFLITMLTAFSCYENEEEYDNSSGNATDTVVKDSTGTVMTIKHIPAEEWSD